ncbi:MAG: hypothetical protein E5W25_36625, partial [Mesorhizobium sp.]
MLDALKSRPLKIFMRHALSLCFYACRYPKTAVHFWATCISLLACLACAQAAPLAAPADTIAV